MDQSDIITLLIAVIGTLGGASAWQYYQKKLELKNIAQEKEREQNIFIEMILEREWQFWKAN